MMIFQVILTLFTASEIFSLNDSEAGKYELLSLKELQNLQSGFKRLENVVAGQAQEINTLKQTNDVLKQQLRSLSNYQDEIKRLERVVISVKEECRVSCQNNLQQNESHVRKERLLESSLPLSQPCCGNDIVAFYAYMSHIEVAPSAHHTLIFDVTKTNIGNAYSHNTGTFTTPKDGVYVFLWKIRLYQAEHSTELIVNQAVYGATFLRAKNGDDGSTTGVVVTHLSQGDEVFVRTHDAYNDGNIHGNSEGHSSFSGWKIN